MTLSKTLQAWLVVEDPQTAQEAWDLLVEIFSDNKRSRSIALKAELRSIKLRDLCIDAYFQKIESIDIILTSFGSPISNDDVEPFSDLKTAHSMPTTEEMRLKSQAQDTFIEYTSSSPMVLLANSGTSARRPNVATDKYGHGNMGPNVTGGNLSSGNLVTSIHVAFHKSSSGSANTYASFNIPPSFPLPQQVLQPNIFGHSGHSGTPDLANGNWNIDTGVGSHLNESVSNLTDIFNSCIYSSVLVGNDYSMPVTNSSHSILPTPHRPLHINNALITPNIVKKLI
ncbi:hypothetical protein Tco_0706282 [Tanacetum coccineum]|uniref:Uncharacterized protein n=1 Tax=Tanacetum coccineum TaxID=301880 RepID=A0ABQ4Y8K9_9ASTR